MGKLIEMRLKSAALESTSHIPPEDRQARLSGAGCGYIRHGEIPLYDAYCIHFLVWFCNRVHHIYAETFEKWLKSVTLDSASFIPPEERQACLSDVGCGYLRLWRINSADATVCILFWMQQRASYLCRDVLEVEFPADAYCVQLYLRTLTL